jgi:hypothetical protein
MESDGKRLVRRSLGEGGSAYSKAPSPLRSAGALQIRISDFGLLSGFGLRAYGPAGANTTRKPTVLNL